MMVKNLLPIGSVVQLKNMKKKIMIIGIMPMKQINEKQTKVYDYMGVPYPEGYIGAKTGALFDHESIEIVVFTGYENKERELFVTTIQNIFDVADNVISDR